AEAGVVGRRQCVLLGHGRFQVRPRRRAAENAAEHAPNAEIPQPVRTHGAGPCPHDRESLRWGGTIAWPAVLSREASGCRLQATGKANPPEAWSLKPAVYFFTFANRSPTPFQLTTSHHAST